MKKPVAVSIAGSDPSAGAGIQADLRMFSALGVYGTTVVTALTAQNPDRVTGVLGVEAGFVRAQINALFEALPIAAMKTGMLWSSEIITTVAHTAHENPAVALVVDPVMIATSGAQLVAHKAIDTYKRELLPRCTLMTPNIDEAQVLLGGETIDAQNQEDAARTLGETFGCAVLLKGGHLTGDPIDLLWEEGRVHSWKKKRLHSVNSHGSGCTLSAAVTAFLAHGQTLPKAVQAAIQTVHTALLNPVTPAPGLHLAGLEETSPNHFKD
ncbi:MAG: bifunctional hydroxymethylpyrimidine kinase/phosphomethylpyrimidine kinase [Myxococcota bacterium]|nr:bifunctional hydroxymethylpyrimidine kinase/phosphomethylpyrimidine kinase [Myxococcota bacterium]